MEEDEQQHPNKNRPSSSSSSQTTEDLNPTLLPEIIFEILLRLSVESLLRCRSVCKAWLSLISDPKFVKSHLDLSVRSHDYAHRRLIYRSYSKSSLKSCSMSKLLCDKSVDAVELDCPLKQSHNYVRIVGSCNGLVCVTNREGILYIWNPTTRRSHRLPRCGVKRRYGWDSRYSFGCLESNNDYKVVGIFQSRDSIEVNVYSMKTGNWKRIGEFPDGHDPFDDSGKYLSGAIHWVVCHDHSWTIVSLDLVKETYDEVPLPVYGENHFEMSLAVLGDWLTVLCTMIRNYDVGSDWDVWVMKEYGVKESWTKLLSIAGPNHNENLNPLCISNNGKLLLNVGSKLSKLFLYDLKDEHITKLQNTDCNGDALMYVESLVAPASLSHHGDDNEE